MSRFAQPLQGGLLAASLLILMAGSGSTAAQPIEPESLCDNAVVTSRQGFASATTLGTSAYNIVASNDGRYLAFESNASDLVNAGSLGGTDTNNVTDIFVYDRETCATERVSLPDSTVFDPNVETARQGNQYSRRPSISADGRFVAFTSRASNLVATDNGNYRDVFVRDRQLLRTFKISVPPGYESNATLFAAGSSDQAEISANGVYVTYYSLAPNIVSNDTNGFYDVFVRDLQTNTSFRASTDSSGGQANGHSVQTTDNHTGNPPALPPSPPTTSIGISADGRYVAFHSWASNLVGSDTNGFADVFVKDRVSGTTQRVSITNGGGQASGPSNYAVISGDGRFVAFESQAVNLVLGDANGYKDVFIRDRTNNVTELVSISTGNTQAFLDSFQPSISSNGQVVAFSSNSGLVTQGDSNQYTDVFVRDRASGYTKIVSSTFNGTQAEGGGSFNPSVSADGLYIAYESGATNLVGSDTNGSSDTFTARWGEISWEFGVEMLYNGTFAGGQNNWRTFGAMVDNDGAGGVFQMYRSTQPGETPVVFQPTGAYLRSGSPIEASIKLGNSSGARKRAMILIQDNNFSDLHVCSFWIAPNSPLRVYTIETHTTKAWTDARMSIYLASPADDLGWLLIDDAAMTYRPALSAFQTRCTDPAVPAPPGGTDSANLLGNPSFDNAGNPPAPWSVFNPSGTLTHETNGGVFEARRTASSAAVSSLLQNTGNTSITSGSPIEVRIDLGSSSTFRQRINVLLHSQNFRDLQTCSFWVPPSSTLQTYVVRTYATNNEWSVAGASISLYAASVIPSGFLRIDNVQMRRRPGLSVVGTQCFEPGSNPGGEFDPLGEEGAFDGLPTLIPTATAIGDIEIPVEIAPLPTATFPPETGEGEGVVPPMEPPMILPTLQAPDDAPKLEGDAGLLPDAPSEGGEG